METRRREATLSGEKPSLAAIWEKKIGGAPMKVTCSRAMRSRPSSGSHEAMSTVGMAPSDGMSTPLSNPDTWARGAGMRTASSGPRPCTAIMVSAL